MAYENGKTYYLIPICATGDAAYNQKILNKQVQPLSLNIQGTGNHYNNRNVNVYSLDWSTDMQWKVMVYDGYARILCAGNTAYGLDYYYGSSNPGNCYIYQISGNDEDSKINFRTINASENLYRIQCYRNNADNDLYLTVTGTANGADVRWQPLDASKATQQTWWLVPIEDVNANSGNASTDINYLTYPCKTMRITQGYAPPYISDSHYYNTRATPIDYPIDEGGDAPSPDRSWMYCPCDEMEVVRVTGVGTTYTNCIWLRSTSKVIMPCGEDYVVMMVTHPNDDTLSGITVGTRFNRGEPMFLEGDDGLSDGYHFHISLGKGSHTNTGWTQNSGGAWVITTSGGAIKPEDGFFIDRNFTNVSSTYGLNFIDKP